MAPSYTRAMRWILQRWFLAGGMRWFLAGYAAGPILMVATVEHSALGLLIVPGMWLMAPLGLILGMLSGIEPAWGPWDGRLISIGFAAGLVVLVTTGLWLEKRRPVPGGGDGTPRVPMARVVSARLAYRLATVAWSRLIGRTLLAIAGAALSCLGALGLGGA